MPECIFCDSSPCACGDRTRKGQRKAAHKPPKIIPPPVTGPVLSVGPVADLPVLNTLRPPKFSAPAAPQALATTESDDDAEWAASIRALAPMLNPEDLHQYSHILSVPPTRKEKIIAWHRVSAWRKVQRA